MVNAGGWRWIISYAISQQTPKTQENNVRKRFSLSLFEKRCFVWMRKLKKNSKGVKMCNEWNILCRERKNYGYICAWDYAKKIKRKKITLRFKSWTKIIIRVEWDNDSDYGQVVVKRYVLTYGVDYTDIFPVTKLWSICIIISLIAKHQWLLF